MMEKTNIEELKEFSKSTNRVMAAKEVPYPLSGIRTFRKYRSWVYIPNNSENTSFFIWYNDPYAIIGLPKIYCGAFIPLSSSLNSKINIRIRNILDKLNFFSNGASIKIGNKRIDKKLIISGNMNSSERKLFTQPMIQDKLLEVLNDEPFMNISLNENNVDFVPELRNTPYLSIINPQKWIFDKKVIERIFMQIEEIRNLIN